MRLNMVEVNVTLLSHYPYPDSKVHGANLGPIWGRQDPGGPHVGPMNLELWISYHSHYEILQITEILRMHEKTVYLKTHELLISKTFEAMWTCYFDRCFTYDETH